MARGKRITEQDFYVLANDCGITWLGPFPGGTKTKTWWQCSQGHRWQGRYNDVQQGHLCSVCGIKRRGDWQLKTPIDYQALARERGYKWLGPFPDTIKRKTYWECGKGHRWEARYNCIQQGRGCPKCGKVATADKSRHGPDDYHVLAQKMGIKWLGPEVSGALAKTEWECSEGHTWQARYNSIQQGQGCPFCAGIVPKTSTDYHVLAQERGFRWMGTGLPANTKAKTLWRCDEGRHHWEVCYSDIQQGYGCPHCWRQRMSEVSKARWARGIYDGVFQSPTSIEVAVAAALDAHDIAHVPQFRPEGCRFIFDEFIFPGLLLETNGTYWHGPEHPKQQERDIVKAAWADEHGYHLVVIWEHEIKERGAWSLIHERVLPLLGDQGSRA